MFVFTALIRGHYNESSDCFVYPKNPYLNQATQKNTCQIFLPPKNCGIKNFKPQIILGSPPSLEIQQPAHPHPPVVSTAEGEWDGNSELLDH